MVKYCFCNIEPQAAAAAVPAAGLLYPVKRHKYILQILFLYAGIRILNTENAILQGHCNYSPFSGLGRGISKHIGENLFQQAPVPLIMKILLDLHAQPHLSVLDPPLYLLAAFPEHPADIQICPGQLKITAAHSVKKGK